MIIIDPVFSSEPPVPVDTVSSPTNCYVNDHVHTEPVPPMEEGDEPGIQYVFRRRSYLRSEWDALDPKPQPEE